MVLIGTALVVSDLGNWVDYICFPMYIMWFTWAIDSLLKNARRKLGGEGAPRRLGRGA